MSRVPTLTVSSVQSLLISVLALVFVLGTGRAAWSQSRRLDVRRHGKDTPVTPAPEHPDPKALLVHEGFEKPEPAISIQTYFRDNPAGTKVYDRNFDVRFVYKGKASLKVQHRRGEHNAVQVIDYMTPEGHDHLFMRGVLFFEKGFQVAPSCEIKLFGFKATPSKRRRGAPGFFNTRLAISRSNGLQLHSYHPGQRGRYADHINTGVQIEYGRWYVFELELKANTVLKATPELLARKPEYRNLVRGEYVVLSDGHARCWVDGRLRAELRNVRYRDYPDYQIRRCGAFPYFGGAGLRNTSPKDQVFYVDEFSISRSYLGPLSTEKTKPSQKKSGLVPPPGWGATDRNAGGN